MAHHKSQVRELVLDFAVGETYAGNKLFWNIDHSADYDSDLFALLMEFTLRLLHLFAVSSNEERSDMVRVRELPWTEALLLLNHLFEIFDHSLILTSLLEGLCEQIFKLKLIIWVALNINP